jgi:hypothetical protein
MYERYLLSTSMCVPNYLQLMAPYLLEKGGGSMPQDPDTQGAKDLGRQMREGRAPLLEAIREAYPPYLLARKSYNRKHEEVREQLGLLNATFASSIKKLRESSRNNQDSGQGMITHYEAMTAFIDKELPGLRKLFEPVGKAYAAYEGILEAYTTYRQQWVGKLPDGDLSGRALELVQQEIEKSLR